ncbi:hypothetical protein OIU78_014315 [Salix suchowensis]|nr:hypothetical protein OIU78_014315 [Salix suchowensis]
MAISPISFLHCLLFFLLTLSTQSSSSSDHPQTFIIHVTKSHKPSLFSSHHDWYTSIIRSLPPSPHPAKLLYNYNHAIHGFSAHLTATQVEKLRRVPGILSVVPDQVRQLHTTHTPAFLGLSESSGLWQNSGYGDGVIIGVLDTGIWPEHFRQKVQGKIVVCDRGGNARVEKGAAVKLAGGLGMILANTADSGEELIADSHLLPATEVAPKVAAFSSRGPNYLTPEILKPDVIAPGVNILAGWTGFVGPTDLEIDPRRVEFNIISGTSMSCPHVSGIVALLRKAYPDWSPAAIKSALVTTAHNLDNSGKNIKDLASGEESTPFIHGAGHVDPNSALNPGLVYDMDTSDYIAFLCAIGPIAMWLHIGGRVKNVGNSLDAVYEVKVNAPANVEINVSPSRLVFSAENKTMSYEITFSSASLGWSSIHSAAFGSIEWSNGIHGVRSPIAVKWRQGSSMESI